MAVNLSPVGGVAAQFFNNDGTVLSGGLLNTYLAGTTTPVATYTTSAGVIAHLNPIQLNSAGRVPASGEIWLTDGITYKFVLTDANDVLIATYDNISGINSNFVNFTNQQEIQTATAGQTVFTLTTIQYEPGTGSLSVFVDGVNQYGPGAQYAFTETSSTVVTFVTGLDVGASVKFTTSAINASSYGNAFQISYTPPYTGSVATNVGDKLAQTVSVMDFGAVGDGTTDDTAAIQAALDNSSQVNFPSGTYVISSALVLSSNSTLIGSNATIQWSAASFAYAITGIAINDIVIQGLIFNSTTSVTTNPTHGIFLQNASRVKVSQCKTTNVNLIYTLSSQTLYANVVSDETSPSFNCSRDVLVEHCSIIGPGTINPFPFGGIFMQYTLRFAVTNCSVQNSGHGIHWWGGDANTGVDGALANPRKCFNGSITNCVVQNIHGGGIWGSMGQWITVSGNTVNTCQDVGIDFEGCFDCTATGNTVTACPNGGLTNFFYTQNLVFSGNTVSQSNGAPAYRCYNDTQNTNNKSVLLTGNTFRGVGVFTSADFINGPIENASFIGNNFYNCTLSCAFNNMKIINVVGNTFVYDIVASGITAFVSVGNASTNANISIKDNQITSLVTHPAGSAGIFVSVNDFNTDTTVNITSNTISGFPIDISIDNIGTNAGTFGLFTIQNNILGAPAFLRSGEASGSTSIVSFENNMYQAKPWPTVTPTTGKWNINNKVYFSAPTSGGFIGAVCTATGTPGTWKNFGAIV